MKRLSFWTLLALMCWVAAPSVAVDIGLGSSTAFSCDASTNTCECRGFADCNLMKTKGVCGDSRGISLICCDPNGGCSCTMGDASKCPANKKPFDSRPPTRAGSVPAGSLSEGTAKPRIEASPPPAGELQKTPSNKKKRKRDLKRATRSPKQ